jgi:hypothetical protein
MVDSFRQRGARAELLRFGFDGRQKGDVAGERPVGVSFVGSLTPAHSKRIRFLEELAARLPGVLQLWAPSLDFVAADSPLRACYRGPAWGAESNGILRRSKIQINVHHDNAGDYADNIRMYDATGLGSLLITDRKKNLPAIFDVGAEILDFGSVDECVSRIEWALTHDAERQEIAARGQARTLRDHTVLERVRQLEGLIGSV